MSTARKKREARFFQRIRKSAVRTFSSSASWNKYKGTINYPINGKYLNEIHNKFVKNGIYEEINKRML